MKFAIRLADFYAISPSGKTAFSNSQSVDASRDYSSFTHKKFKYYFSHFTVWQCSRYFFYSLFHNCLWDLLLKLHYDITAYTFYDFFLRFTQRIIHQETKEQPSKVNWEGQPDEWLNDGIFSKKIFGSCLFFVWSSSEHYGN